MPRSRYRQIHMGVKVTVTCFAASQATADVACAAAFARFAELDDVMSDYRPASELMQLCRRAGEGPVEVSPNLFVVLGHAQEFAKVSDGALDVTCGPLVALWREARASGVLPCKSAIEEARSRVGYLNLILDQPTQTAELRIAGMGLDLGGIAKGYACDQALASLKEHGVDQAMVEAGGDIALSGPPPGKQGWAVGILGSVLEPLCLADCAISTSGDAEQVLEIDGKRYSHILDPRSAMALTNSPQVTVIASTALLSDSLATVSAVLGAEEAAPVLASYGATGIP